MSCSLTRTVCALSDQTREVSKTNNPPDFMGGNSTKATSGINGALTRTQVDEKIADSVKQFYDDTLKSAREKARPDLIKVLTYKSAAAVEWLQDVFNLDLTLVSRLGYVESSGFPTNRFGGKTHCRGCSVGGSQGGSRSVNRSQRDRMNMAVQAWTLVRLLLPTAVKSLCC